MNTFFSVKYKPKDERYFEDLPKDSELPLNAFSDSFSSIESITGGMREVELRIYNDGLPDSIEFFVVKFDFSESFSYNSRDYGYDNESDDSPYRGVSAGVAIGTPNQSKVQAYQTISSDYHAHRSLTDYIGIIFTRNRTLAAELRQIAGAHKFIHSSNFPPSGGFVPVKLFIELPRGKTHLIEQKPVSINIPENLPSFQKNISDTQVKSYKSLPESSLSDRSRVFVSEQVGAPFDRTSYSVLNRLVSVPMHVLGLQYFALYNYKYDGFQFKAARHPFEIVVDGTMSNGQLTTPTHLPSILRVDSSKPLWNGESVSYLGRSSNRHLHEIIFELLGYAKYIHNVYMNLSTANIVLFNQSLNRLETNLLRLVALFDDLKDTSNYVTSSGTAASAAKSFALNIFVRSMLKYVDFMRKHVRNLPDWRNLSHYEGVGCHIDGDDCSSNERYPNFPVFTNLSPSEVVSDIKILAASLLFIDFVRFIELNSFDRETLYQNDVTGDIDYLYQDYLELIKPLGYVLKHGRYFDPAKPTEDMGANIADPELYPYIALVLAYCDEFQAAEGTTPLQAWHFINKYYRYKSIKSQTLPLLLNNPSDLPGVNLSDPSTFTQVDFLTILGDIDIISTSIFTLIDCVYQKQTSTTLSVKMNITNY